jgi:medium-chain acyl-[acyl-carrier-protein] hydrolase
MNNSWFVASGDTACSQYRLFCFPYGGAGSGAFRAWGKALVPGMEICAVVPPGRERRFMEPRFESVEPLVACLAKEIVPLLDRPFAFFGHSVGALIAFELARRLRRGGLAQPRHLFVSGRAAPQCPGRGGELRNLSGDALVEAVRRISHAADGPPPDPAMIKALEPLLRSDFSITETYRYVPDAPLDIPISAFGATEDATVGVPEVLEWRAQTTMAFECEIFEGGHFFIDTHREAITGTIRARTIEA